VRSPTPATPGASSISPSRETQSSASGPSPQEMPRTFHAQADQRLNRGTILPISRRISDERTGKRQGKGEGWKIREGPRRWNGRDGRGDSERFHRLRSSAKLLARANRTRLLRTRQVSAARRQRDAATEPLFSSFNSLTELVGTRSQPLVGSSLLARHAA
jgi:hypothetical protein